MIAPIPPPLAPAPPPRLDEPAVPDALALPLGGGLLGHVVVGVLAVRQRPTLPDQPSVNIFAVQVADGHDPVVTVGAALNAR